MQGDEGSMAPGVAHINRGPSESKAIEHLIASGSHRDALARCAKAYAAPLGRLCMAFTGSQAESEELVQETLLAAFDGFGQFRGEGSVRSWLFGIARRICGRHVELRSRREARLRLVHDASDDGRGADIADMTVRREQAERARTALSKLKPSEREAVVLRYHAELSFREVAQACGVDEAAARKRVSRALARMRADLVEE